MLRSINALTDKMPFDFRQDAYVSLRNIIAERTSPIISWVGSGLSAPAGVPVWADLKGRLIDAMERKIETYLPPDQAQQRGKLAAATSQPNPWLGFEMLQEQVGATTYRDTIREAMRPADVARAPQSYLSLWKLRIRGLINLNIDRLATRAFVETTSASPLEFTGKQGTSLGMLLKENRPFILNLHGHADDYSTWIFTKSELEALQAEPSYWDFIKSCFYSNTVLFLGLTVDDVAVGGHLEALFQKKLNTGTHFWVTSRTDVATDEWAERFGVRVIRYDATGGDHSALDAMFKDLLDYIPPEDAPVTIPVVSKSAGDRASALPPVAELAKWDANEIRVALNSHVRSILSRGAAAEKDYEEFRRIYDEVIYRAWYLNTTGRKEPLLGYTLEFPAAKGAFGRVYQATDARGDLLAIKVLLEEIRNNAELLQSFRRGVRSMKILSDRKIDGVAIYRDSSEIPAFVVMDWIDGPSLHEAVEARGFQDWRTILRTAKHLTKVIRRAHELPERVLHRDLRPSNVMLRDFYTDPDNWKVVVLDFDLSWHLGAEERSVVHGSTLYGYLAPEQIVRVPGVSTRHSAVDSFGLGMVMFFMASGRDPLPAEHRHFNWAETVRSVCRKHIPDEWISLPERFSRLIMSATRDRQAERWDVSQIKTELDQLLVAATAPQSVTAPDLLAEEVASRASIFSGYTWRQDESSASHQLPTGLQVTLRGDLVKRKLALRIDWQNTGVQQHRKVGKWVSPASQSCEAVLKSAGWRVSRQVDSQSFTIEADVPIETVSKDPAECAVGIDRAMEPLRME